MVHFKRAVILKNKTCSHAKIERMPVWHHHNVFCNRDRALVPLQLPFCHCLGASERCSCMTLKRGRIWKYSFSSPTPKKCNWLSQVLKLWFLYHNIGLHSFCYCNVETLDLIKQCVCVVFYKCAPVKSMQSGTPGWQMSIRKRCCLPLLDTRVSSKHKYSECCRLALKVFLWDVYTARDVSSPGKQRTKCFRIFFPS